MSISPLTPTLSSPHAPTETYWGYDYDLVIVGGGIVGLTLAAALKDSGLKILLI